MTRVKRGTTSLKRRRKILKYAKGYKWGAKSKERTANERLLHAWSNAFADRRKKKGNFRRLWQTKINAGARVSGLNYSKLVSALKKADIRLDRKMLAELAEHHPEVFKKVIEEAISA
ncbi:MAG: 50S ribosomal protein L20 [Candidatus Niyogibacteria bacterium]|nr:MAG: 50S ribosomal protein L20 [Candidatus Niyogibacteria bacterium]